MTFNSFKMPLKSENIVTIVRVLRILVDSQHVDARDVDRHIVDILTVDIIFVDISVAPLSDKYIYFRSFCTEICPQFEGCNWSEIFLGRNGDSWNRFQVEYDVAEEGPLHQLKRSRDADRSGHDRRHEHAGAEKFAQKQF
jgi:hypothetical protein